MNQISLSDQLLADAAYWQRCRSWRRWHDDTVLARILASVSDRQAANVLIRANPAWTRQDHQHYAERHEDAARLQRDAYHCALDAAALATFGRPFQFFDYRICCIGREEFSEDWKEVLRYHGYTGPKHRRLAAAHRAASRSRRIR